MLSMSLTLADWYGIAVGKQGKPESDSVQLWSGDRDLESRSATRFRTFTTALN